MEDPCIFQLFLLTYQILLSCSWLRDLAVSRNCVDFKFQAVFWLSASASCFLISFQNDANQIFNKLISYRDLLFLRFRLSGDGNVRILRQSCTSGYKYETFRICSLILSNKYFLVSHHNFFPFSRWLMQFSRWPSKSFYFTIN